MDQHKISASDLGIELASKQESELFRWFLACLLFGKPVQQEVAKRAYEVLVKSGIDSLEKLASNSWDDLVGLLDKAHYVRYDHSTAAKLLEVTRTLQEQWGTVSMLVSSAASAYELEQRLLGFKGIGPTTAAIFVRDIDPIWFNTAESHDYGAAKAAAGVLQDHGYQAYIVGGAVRDLQLGLKPKDFDLVTNAMPEQIGQISEFTKSVYKDTAQAFGVTRIKFRHNGRDNELEIATFRRDVDPHLGRRETKVEFATLEEDVLRRDLTINALALNPLTGEIIDYVGGMADLQRRKIRFIGKARDRIAEDPLRLMRAIRFKNHLGFMYDEETANAIISAVQDGEVEKIATDRLREELTRLLVHSTRRTALQDLDSFGILQRVLPEVTAGKQTAQQPQYHAEGSVWKHELLILDELPEHPGYRLAWAALLHDIGKNVTAHGYGDNTTFNEHYSVGADMARRILHRLKFSRRDTADIAWMVHYHMAIDDLPKMTPAHQRRMLGHSAFADLLELHKADAAASWRASRPHDKKPEFPELENLWREYQEKPEHERQPSLKRDLGIDGHWLIQNFGNLSGRKLGQILLALEEHYQNTADKDQEVYKRIVRRMLGTA